MPYDSAKDVLGRPDAPGADIPARRVAAVVPNDATDLPAYARSLYIGVAGDVKVIPIRNEDGDPVIFKDHAVGYMPVQVRRVLATGTTATDILALY